jgi:hypothetical protein
MYYISIFQVNISKGSKMSHLLTKYECLTLATYLIETEKEHLTMQERVDYLFRTAEMIKAKEKETYNPASVWEFLSQYS